MPSSLSSSKFCMLRAPTWITSTSSNRSRWRSVHDLGDNGQARFLLGLRAAGGAPPACRPWKAYGDVRGLNAPPRSSVAPAAFTSRATAHDLRLPIPPSRDLRSSAKCAAADFDAARRPPPYPPGETCGSQLLYGFRRSRRTASTDVEGCNQVRVDRVACRRSSPRTVGVFALRTCGRARPMGLEAAAAAWLTAGSCLRTGPSK